MAANAASATTTSTSVSGGDEGQLTGVKSVPKILVEGEKPPLKSELVPVLMPKRTRCAVSIREDETDNWANDDLDDKEEYLLTLKDASVKTDLLERLATFRRNRELCDVVLFVREREIFAHKVVLAAVSPALFDMFVEEASEEQAANVRGQTSSPPRELPSAIAVPAKPQAAAAPTTATPTATPLSFFEFEHTDLECMEALVNFAYTASLEIRSRKVAELYKCAHSLKMMPVVKACASYLAQNLSISNCIGIRKQASSSSDCVLIDKVDRFIEENVEGVVNESVEFSQLPCIKTRVIVNGGEIVEGGGSLARRALQYFSEQHAKGGEHPIETLLSKTHLLYVEEDKRLADCAEMDERSSVGSCDIIQDYKKGPVSKPVVQVGAPPVQHRVTGATQVSMGNNGCKSTRSKNKYSSTESLDSVSSADSVENEEKADTKLLAVHQTGDRFWIALVLVFRRLAVISLQLTDEDEINKGKERNGNGHVSAASSGTATPTGNGSVDPQKAALLARLVACTGSERKPLASMNEARCSIGAVFSAGKIIVCGGYDRGECLKTVEEYDVHSGVWSPQKSMKDGRGRFDAAVLSGKVYAIAGSNGATEMNLCEVFDRKAGKWQRIKPLEKARSHNGCTSMEGYVYTVGGSFDNLPLKTVERYSPETDTWEEVASLEVARYQAGVVSWRGLIIAAGGCDRWACSNVVEAYDQKTNTWRQLAKLRTPRRGCGCVVYKDQLFVIGGHDGTQSLSTVEVLETPTGTWRQGPSLVTSRANTRAVVTAGGVIYVIGGFNGNHFLNSIELLENESVGWRNWQQSADENMIEEEDEEEEEEVAETETGDKGDCV